MIINLVVFIDVGKLFSFCRGIVGTVIETVSLPRSTGELGPFDVVFK